MSELRLESVVVRFGGTVALDRLNLSVRLGQIIGLVGPNGAGKTTALHVFSGLVRPAAGSVRLDELDISRWSPARRGRAGIGRTFQKAHLFESLTVLDNVAISREAGLRATPRRVSLDGGREALERCGLLGLARASVAELTTGQRRLVELARSMTGSFRYLLLDEPAAGLTQNERAHLTELLGEIRAERKVGVLLVEHDLELVASVSDAVVVLEDGDTIYEGPATGWTRSERVRRAYLRRHALR